MFLLLGLAAHAIAHGNDHDEDSLDMEMDMSSDKGPGTSDLPPSYFDYPDDKLFIYSHIAIMTLSWVFALPIGMARFLSQADLVQDPRL